VVADILNIAGIRQASDGPGKVDPLLAAGSWRPCALADSGDIRQRHYVRFKTKDAPGVIGNVGGCFGERNVSIQSIVQFNASDAGAEIVVITHEVSQRQMNEALEAIQALPEVSGRAAHLGCL
jgi:homoserine dehydrogenase